MSAIGNACPVCTATLMSNNSCKCCGYKDKTLKDREEKEDELDEYMDEFFNLETDDMKIKFLLSLYKDVNSLATDLFTHVFGLEDWSNLDDDHIDSLISAFKDSYRKVMDDEAEKILLGSLDK